MRTFFAWIKYNIIGFIMWIGWLPLLLWRTGFYKAYKVAFNFYGDKKLALETTWRTFISAYGSFATGGIEIFNRYKSLIWPLFIYFILLIILSKYRQGVYGEFMDDDAGLNAKDIKEEKRFNREMDSYYSKIFKKAVPEDNKNIKL